MNNIEKLQEFLKINTEDSFLQHALALEYIKGGNDTKAELLFKEVLAREPGYTGSYYHLGKLLERMHRPVEAATIYEKGMAECKKINDGHSLNELKAALEDLIE